MKSKKLILALLLVLAALCAPLAVFASDMEYEGEIDPYTGKPATEEVNEIEGKITYLSKNVGYNHNTHLFQYGVSPNTVTSNVVDGMVTTTPVSVDVPNGVAVMLYRDGEKVEVSDMSRITDPGKYVLNVGESQTVEEMSLRFTIVGTTTGEINEYLMPEGFRVSSVMMDNKEIENSDASRVDLTEEGYYEIRYKCIKTQASYSLNVQIDHTGPVLKLANVVNGRSNGKVDISDYNRNDKIRIIYNGNVIKYKDQLTESGTYNIVLEDKAGNRTEYNFLIPIYFNVSGVVFILIILAVIALLIAYPIYSRKHLRVR